MAGEDSRGRVTDEPLTVMDLLPTFVRLAGGSLPEDRALDGRDAWPLPSGDPEAGSPHEAIYYLRGSHVDGIRVGDWKYHDAPRRGNRDITEAPSEMLFHLGDHVGETKNLIDTHPDRADHLRKRKDAFEAEFRKTQRAAAVAGERRKESR